MTAIGKTKLRGPLRFVGVTSALALLAGWAIYRNNPAGLLQHAGENSCPSVVHSFSTAYLAIIGIVGAAALVVGITCVVVRDLGLLARVRPQVHAMATSCALSVAGLLLMSLIAIPLKSLMPLAPSLPCLNPSMSGK